MKRLLYLLLPIVLISCAPPPTQTEALATALIAGCWPGNVATPRAVTVTPDPLLATPTLAITATVGAGTPTASQPTATRLPTTTPYPRCTPEPGVTLIPYPTPVPPRPPYPTQEPKLRQGGSDTQTTLQLPGHTYALALAVHPTEGWPVVGIMQRFSESSDPIQSFVRVFNPLANKWGPAQQVDVGASSNGQDRFGSTVVGVTGDRVVHVVYGASDAGPSGAPPARLWARTSSDYGTTWSAPASIAEHCWAADDMATSAEGWIVVTANCYVPRGTGEATPTPAMIVRQPNGHWQPPERLAMPDWYGAEGALEIVGDGTEARAVALRFGEIGATSATAYLISKRLADPGGWQLQTRAATLPQASSGGWHWHPRGLAFARPQANASASSGVLFTWTGAERSGAYALTSLDGGLSWGAVEPIVYDGQDPQQTGTFVAWAAPAYDPAADRLLALWTCCGDATYQAAESTHYASWSVPGSGSWQPRQRPGAIEPGAPIVLGSRAAWTTVTAQASNARVVWVAWVEQGNQINVRTLNLNQLVPVEAYPTPTLQPSPGGTP